MINLQELGLRYVGGDGPSNAKLAVVGEAPGAEEERLGRPFAGPSGKMVDNLLSKGGSDRRWVYTTNVSKVRPPRNVIKDLPILGVTIDDFLPQLHEEINALKPNCILAFGNTALQALTGKKGIEKWRGSILQANFGPYKVVPTLHPASILHGEADGKMKSWKDITYIQWDVNRAIQQSKFPELILPKRELFACRSSRHLHLFLQMYADCDLVSVDIETYRTVPICIAFAFNKEHAISVPLVNYPNHSGMEYEELAECFQMVAELMANERIRKIGQNFKFDQRLLHTCANGTLRFGIGTRGFYFDTLLAFRVLYPELSGKLEFSTSVMTEEPYYKDEGKEFNPLKDRYDRLLLYNARDAAVTFEVYEKCYEELKLRNLEKFFFEVQMPLHDFYSRIEERGILQDTTARDILKEKYEEQRVALQTEFNGLTAEYIDKELNVASNSKKGDMPFLVYGCMKCPPRKGTDEKTIDALRRNGFVKDPKKLRILDLILEIRKVRKTIGTYVEAETDFRGRLLTQYRIILETGRTSTSILKPPVATKQLGLAFQTITKHGDIGSDLRRMFIPDPGYVFIEPDLSGAEARVVAHLANDNRLLKAFRYDIDVHRLTAAWIWDVSLGDLLEIFWNTEFGEGCLLLAADINKILKQKIDDDQRQIGKKFRHAGHYDMQKKTAGENAGVSEWRANEILKKFHATNPNIKGVFHKEIQSFLKWNNRTLTSPNGRQRLFLNQWGEELFREAYAQIPQSTVSDQNKKAAQEFEKRCPRAMILAESHDSFLTQVPLALGEQFPMKYIDHAIEIMREEMEQPIDFSGCSLPRGCLTIPCEIKFSESNWEEMKPI